MKILIGIPAYNEAQTIGDVITSLPKRIKGVAKIDILVVSDGSTDNTEYISDKKGALVISHFLNRGLGGALKTIFEYTRHSNYDILVTCDADGQHLGSDVLKVIESLLKNNKDVVIGVREYNTKNSPKSKIIINHIANFLTYLLCGIYTHDSQSGLRAFNKKAINLINTQTDGMEVSSEIFKEIKNNNLTYGEIPIKAIYTDYSKMKGQRLGDAPDVLFRLILRMIK